MGAIPGGSSELLSWEKEFIAISVVSLATHKKPGALKTHGFSELGYVIFLVAAIPKRTQLLRAFDTYYRVIF